MGQLSSNEIRQAVRARYGQIAESEGKSSCCGSTAQCGTQAERSQGQGACCTTENRESDLSRYLEQLSYSLEEQASAPAESNLGLGCGNPTAIAALEKGEVVLDLGSGAGFDCFLAARQVGPTGYVIGVDMTPEMVTRARQIASKTNTTNVEFRLGEIEHLPVQDNSVDVVTSNCVINLSPDKAAVFQEAFRVLKEGGRLAISDIVRIGESAANEREDVDLITSCIGGAVSISEVERILHESGFQSIRVRPNGSSAELIREWSPGMETSVTSATIEAVKPLKKNHGSLVRISY